MQGSSVEAIIKIMKRQTVPVNPMGSISRRADGIRIPVDIVLMGLEIANHSLKKSSTKTPASARISLVCPYPGMILN